MARGFRITLLAIILVLNATAGGKAITTPVQQCQCCCCTQGADLCGPAHTPKANPFPDQCPQCIQSPDSQAAPKGDLPSRTKLPKPTDSTAALLSISKHLCATIHSMAWRLKLQVMDFPDIPIYLKKSSMLC